MSLSEVDRQLLQRCLDEAPQAWQDFVDRFLGMVIHVVHHTAEARGESLDASSRDDLVSEVFLVILRDDRAVLRRFRRHCSLATYLTVIARRVIIRSLNQSQRDGGYPRNLEDHLDSVESNSGPTKSDLGDREEVERLLLRLDSQEANVVRLFHLEGKSYREISQEVGLAENSIGSMLSRARHKMRQMP